MRHSPEDRDKIIFRTRALCYAWLHKHNVRTSLVDHYLRQTSMCIMDFSSGIPGCMPIAVQEVLKLEAGDRLVDVCFSNCMAALQDARDNRLTVIQVLCRCLDCMPIDDDEDLNEREKYRRVMKTIAAYVEGGHALNSCDNLEAWLRAVFQACGLLPETGEAEAAQRDD